MSDLMGGLIGIALGFGYLVFFLVVATIPFLIDEYLNNRGNK